MKVSEPLKENKSENSPILAAFDLDGTLLSSNSSFAFCQYLVEKRELKKWQMGYCALYYFFHLYFRLSLPKLHQCVFKRLFRGKSVSHLQKVTWKFIEEKISSLWFMPALEVLHELKRQGAYIIVLSNSPDFLVKAIVAHIGIEEAIGTEYKIDHEGILSSVGEILDGEEKSRILQRVAFINKIDKTYAFSDSIHDLPFLEAASIPIVVNPKSDLKCIAEKKGWKILI